MGTAAFEASGIWWLPGSPQHQVVGQLKFAPSAGFALDLPTGTLGSQEETFERLNRMGALGSPAVGSVLGILKDGRHVVLFDAFNSGFSLSAPGMMSESYQALRGVVGSTHLEGEVEIREVRLKIALLRDWVGVSEVSLALEAGPNGKGVGAVELRRTPLDDESLVYGDGWNVMLSHFMGLSGDPVHGVTLSHDCGLTVRLPRAMPVSDVVEAVVGPLVSFFMFALDCPTALESLEVQDPESGEWHELYFAIGERMRDVADSRQWPDMLLPLFGKLADARDMLARWLDLEGDARYAASLMGSLVSDRGTTMNYRLLLAAQGLESVHRSQMSGNELSDEEFARRLDHTVSGCSDRKTKLWAKRRLQHANFKSLEVQLRELYKFAGPAASRIAPDRDGFLADLRKTRNFFAHGGDVHSMPVELSEIGPLTDGAVQLLRAALLRMLGLGPTEVLNVLSENQGFIIACVHSARQYPER